jgi:CO/xanthine dehydrogenase Mo-binding subunit
LKDVPGVLAEVRDGRFIGVVTEREEQAVRARSVLQAAARWQVPGALAHCADIHAFLRENAEPPTDSVEAQTKHPSGTRRLHARYTKLYIAHAAMGPSCAVARWNANRTRLEVWSHGQGVFPLRAALSRVLEVAPECITVTHQDGAGCYGHNGADDAALDAALLARAVAPRPVKLQWMRDDEFRWEPYGPAMTIEIAAELDASGAIVHWDTDLWSQPHSGRPGREKGERTSGLLAAWHLQSPFARASQADSPLAAGGGSDRNAAPLYRIPGLSVRKHVVNASALRVSSLRGLGAYANVFAIESFMDELAHAAGRDPVEYRLAHMEDSRARAVIELAARTAGWSDGRPPAAGRSRGFAFSRYKNIYGYLALVCEVDLEREPRVTRVVCAADVGQIVNPDGVKNQIEGGIVQAVSWTLKERVTYDAERITSVDWSTYPILGFNEVPDIEVHLIDRPGEPPLGAGEISCGPTAAAIANAVHAALKVRIRDLPITREGIVAALGAG